MEQSFVHEVNQQRRIEDRLYWLGGIIDGEGMVTVCKRHENGKKQNGWNPRISIVNTDLKIINEVIDILNVVKIPHYIQSKKDKKNPNWKIKYEILMQGIKRCNYAAPKLVDYLIAKKGKMTAMIKWCEYRLSLSRGAVYTQKDLDLINLIRESSISLRDYTQHQPAVG